MKSAGHCTKNLHRPLPKRHRPIRHLVLNSRKRERASYNHFLSQFDIYIGAPAPTPSLADTWAGTTSCGCGVKYIIPVSDVLTNAEVQS